MPIPIFVSGPPLIYKDYYQVIHNKLHYKITLKQLLFKYKRVLTGPNLMLLKKIRP